MRDWPIRNFELEVSVFRSSFCGFPWYSVISCVSGAYCIGEGHRQRATNNNHTHERTHVVIHAASHTDWWLARLLWSRRSLVRNKLKLFGCYFHLPAQQPLKRNESVEVRVTEGQRWASPSPCPRHCESLPLIASTSTGQSALSPGL